MQKVLSYLDNRRKISSLILSTIILFFFMIINRVTDYHYDSGEYYRIAQSIMLNPNFIINPELFIIRAYSWPLMLAFLNGFGFFNLYVYWFFYSFFYAFLLSIIIADLFEEILKIKVYTMRRIAPLILLILFWPGLLLYPLSDIASVLVSITSLYFLLLLRKQDKIMTSFLFSLTAGFLSDCAVNIRAPYMYNLYLGIIILIIIVVKKKNPTLIVSTIFGYIFGILLSAAPQLYFNFCNYGVVGIGNPLSYWNGNNRAIYLLYEGALIPRYETYVGINSSIRPAFYGWDPIVTSIFQKEGIILTSADQNTIFSFIKLVLKYPLEFLTVYFSHFINCFDVRYGDIYIKDFGGVKRVIIQILSTLLYSTLFIDIKNRLLVCQNSLLSRIKKIVSCDLFWVGLFIILPTIISLPGHIEPRYALAMHIFMYLNFSYIIKLKFIFIWVKNNIIQSILIFMTLLVCMLLIQNWSLALSGYSGLIY